MTVQMMIVMTALMGKAMPVASTPCPYPSAQQQFPSGIRLSQEETCLFRGPLEVTGGVQLSDVAQLTLENVSLTLRASAPNPNITMSGQSQLTIRGVANTTTTIRLQETSAVLWEVQEPTAATGPVVSVEGNVELQGVLKFGRRATYKITQAMVLYTPYILAGSGGDTQLIEDAQLIISSAVINSAGSAHDTVATGRSIIDMTNSHYNPGMLGVSDQARLSVRGTSRAQSHVWQMQVEQQAEADIVNTSIGDVYPVLNAEDWGTFEHLNPDNYTYDQGPSRFRLRLRGCQVYQGWVFYVQSGNPGTRVRIKDAVIGIALVVHDIRAQLSRLTVGLFGHSEYEKLSALEPLGIHIWLRNANHTGWALYAHGRTDLRLSSDALYETEAYDQSTLYISSTTLYPNYLSAEGDATITVTRSTLLPSFPDPEVGSLGNARCLDRGTIQIFDSTIRNVGFAAMGSSSDRPASIELINSPTPVYLRAVGHSDISLKNSGRRDQIREIVQESPARITITSDPQGSTGAAPAIVAYPVPFQPALDASHRTITFANVPKGTVIKIFTVSGDLVRTLSADDDTGQTVWDVTNSRGEGVASDVYLYVAERNGTRRTGKLVIIR